MTISFIMLGPQLRELLNWPRPLPLEDERVRLLHEVKQIITAKNPTLIFVSFIPFVGFEFCEFCYNDKA